MTKDDGFKPLGNIESFLDNIYKGKRSYQPFYSDQADYNTNSKSYYDDLSRKARLIEILAHRIWEYDEELQKRFDEWDKLIADFPRYAIELFREWLRDGTIEKIIREELEIFKAEVRTEMKAFELEIKNLIKDLDEYLNNFDIRTLEPTFINGFGGIRNAVNQALTIDYETNHIITTQSDSKNPEGFFINKLSPSGKLISYMWIEKGGHGTTIALDRVSNGQLKIWFYHIGANKLVQLAYQDFKYLKLEEALELTDYNPKSITSAYSVVMDDQNDKLVFRFSDGLVQIRSRRDVYDHVDKVEETVNIDKSEMTDTQPMQGIAVSGNDLYWLSGTSALSQKIRISKYSVKDNKKLFSYDFNLTYEKGYNKPTDNFKEPEGIFLHVNPYNKKKTLLFGMTVGEGGRRYNMLYGLMQVGAKEHWEAMTDLERQNYKMTKDDGRALSIRDNVTSLEQLIETGYYYLEGRFIDLITDFPYPRDTEGWFLEITPKTQTLGFMQILTRFSSGKKTLSMQRSATHNRDKDIYSFGVWTINETKSYHQEYISGEQWGNKLSNIIFPGEYYMTGNSGATFTDLPNDFKDTGAWLNVSSGNSSNEVRQELTSNTSESLTKAYRNVNYETKEAKFDWKIYYPIPKS